MSEIQYEAVIGLEVHVQLSSNTKAFSDDSSAFGAAPNHHVDPISLGHPGTLPVANKTHVEYAVRMGLATNCKIRETSIFARKHYFYPDLPKGYQISQFDKPTCEHGSILVPAGVDGDPRPIGITRIHLEEDAGKLTHDQDPSNSLVDLNRCGVPLVEIVSEPDFRTAREVFHYLKKMRQLVRYLEISDGNMNEGSLRCDANISVRPVGQVELGTKTELKNMNSFRNVERAIEYEIKRQIRVIKKGGVINQETRLWDVNDKVTRLMRTKEAAHDYRYFPDPDLGPVIISQEKIAEIKNKLPELPEAKQERYVKILGLSVKDASQLTEERDVAAYFEAVLTKLDEIPLLAAAKASANMVMGDVLRTLNENQQEIANFQVDSSQLAGLILMRHAGKINSSAAQTIFDLMVNPPAGALESGTLKTAEEIAVEQNLMQVSDASALLPIVKAAIENNPKQVEQFKNGKPSLIGFFIGQVMRDYKGSPDPSQVRKMLLEHLS